MYNSGKTRMRPVYVNDVAEAIAKLVYNEQVGGVVELYGPREYTFKGLMEFFFDVTKRKRTLVLDYPKAIIKLKKILLFDTDDLDVIDLSLRFMIKLQLYQL